jgi:hypothetical protein
MAEKEERSASTNIESTLLEESKREEPPSEASTQQPPTSTVKNKKKKKKTGGLSMAALFRRKMSPEGDPYAQLQSAMGFKFKNQTEQAKRKEAQL